MAKNYDTPTAPDRFATGSPDIAAADPFRRLVAIMDRLRGPGGCPWDREQTHDTLKQYLIEESYELLDAIAARSDAELREELGDVLLQVVFHAQLAAEEGRFTIDDVCAGIAEKLLRRHPHVFGDTQADTAGQVLRNWEQIKLAEKAAKRAGEEGRAETNGEAKPAPIFQGIPKHLPALQRAARAQERAARVGFDWPALKPVLDKIREELAEWETALAEAGLDDVGNPHLAPERMAPGADGAAGPAPIDAAIAARGSAIEEEFGDLLFALVNASRFLHIEPEDALQRATGKFIRRYGAAQRLAEEGGIAWEGLSLEAMDGFWNRAKKVEASAKGAAAKSAAVAPTGGRPA